MGVCNNLFQNADVMCREKDFVRFYISRTWEKKWNVASKLVDKEKKENLKVENKNSRRFLWQ